MEGPSAQCHQYSWQDCDDFQMPDNSVWYGQDDDGSDIFCGKAWCDGQEVPAKIIPQRRECRVVDNGFERTVPRCRKVLVCRGSSGDQCTQRRDQCQRRRHHCHHHDSSSESEEEEVSTSTTTTSSKNESRLIIRSIKCRSTSSITVEKKTKKKHEKKKDHRPRCWDERRTRMVPKVTVEPKVRYVPKVTMEKTVRYEPESYVTRVCCDDRCEPCGPCEPREPCGPCEDPCRREPKCKEVLICDRSKKEEDRCIRPTRCDPPSPEPKAKCW